MCVTFEALLLEMLRKERVAIHAVSKAGLQTVRSERSPGRFETEDIRIEIGGADLLLS